MKIIETKYIDLGDDPDFGESLIGQGLIKNKDLLPDFSYVNILMSPLINNIGVHATQHIINDIVNNNEDKLIFVCQHIHVGYIDFGKGNKIFSTHSKIGSNVYPIPHYSATYDVSKIRKERDMLFSFVGNEATHTIRQDLIKEYPDKCISTENTWMSSKYRSKYLDYLGRSKFSLCPRGTGISSLRQFESLKMGSVPVIISDDLELPIIKDHFDWSFYSVRIKEFEWDRIENILSEYSNETIKQMSLKGQEYWEEYCSDDNLYKTIIETLK